MDLEVFLAAALYLVTARLSLDALSGTVRDVVFAVLNLCSLAWMARHYSVWNGSDFALYVAIVVVVYLLIRMRRPGPIAIALPIVLLALLKFAYPLTGWRAPVWIGVSYMMFRLSWAAMEERAGAVKVPNVFQFIGFSFYLPTMLVGPINPIHEFMKCERRTPLRLGLVAENLGRMVYGYFQFGVVAPIVNHLSFRGHWNDGNQYGLSVFLVSCVASYLYVYFNFKGFCDIVAAVSALLGVPVIENFNRPLSSRNVKDFWNRWHISLSTFMRDMVFTPLSKTLVRLVGPKYSNHVVAVVILVVFTLIGLWHGTGKHFVLFGAIHAVGVIANHYYTIWLKRRLGKAYTRHMENRLFRGLSVGSTFLYVSLSFCVFENDLARLLEILHRIHGW